MLGNRPRKAAGLPAGGAAEYVPNGCRDVRPLAERDWVDKRRLECNAERTR